MEMTLEQEDGRTFTPGAVVAGIVLLAMGLAMLLDTTGVLSIQPGRLIGPFVLIGMGTLMLVGRGCAAHGGAVMREPSLRRRNANWGSGVWLIGLGCWMLVSQTHLFGLSFGTSWPLLLILMGLLIAARGWK
jgi:hypothetical protein